LLVALTDMGYAHVRRALNGSFDLVVAYTHSQALTALKEGAPDAILCSIHFDESRMLDFLVAAKQVARKYPLSCRGTLAHYDEHTLAGGVRRLHCGDWWRRRESNPRPQALHSQDYMLSLVV